VELDSDFENRIYGLKCIVDLHAAPECPNGMEHSDSRYGQYIGLQKVT
jgi:hypothetical protein